MGVTTQAASPEHTRSGVYTDSICASSVPGAGAIACTRLL